MFNFFIRIMKDLLSGCEGGKKGFYRNVLFFFWIFHLSVISCYLELRVF